MFWAAAREPGLIRWGGTGFYAAVGQMSILDHRLDDSLQVGPVTRQIAGWVAGWLTDWLTGWLPGHSVFTVLRLQAFLCYCVITKRYFNLLDANLLDANLLNANLLNANLFKFS